MKVVKLLVMSLALMVGVVVQAATDQNGFAIVRGKISVPADDNTIELQHVVNGQLELHSSSMVDAKGRFAFMVPVNEAGFYRLNYAGHKQKQMVRLYLQAGLDLDLEVDEASHRLTGNKLGHNKLVVEWNNKFQAFNKYTRFGGSVTYENFYPFLENEGLQSGEQFIEKIDTGDQQFDELMALAVNTDIERACYRFLWMPRSKHPEKGNYPKAYYDWQRPGKFSDPRLLELGDGYDMMESYFDFTHVNLGESAPLEQKLAIAMKNIIPGQLKELYLYEHFSRYKTSKGLMEKYYQNVEPVRQYLTSQRSKDLLVELEKEFHSQPGQPGFNFICEDTGGSPVAFDSFRGKVVYVDIWATWCGPCKAEIPHLQKLEQALHGEDIAFVSISIDADKDDWLEFMDENDMTGTQLHADEGPDSEISINYEINTIPRFMLFDREGKIVDLNASRPSSPELKAELLKLIRN